MVQTINKQKINFIVYSYVLELDDNELSTQTKLQEVMQESKVRMNIRSIFYWWFFTFLMCRNRGVPTDYNWCSNLNLLCLSEVKCCIMETSTLRLRANEQGRIFIVSYILHLLHTISVYTVATKALVLMNCLRENGTKRKQNQTGKETKITKKYEKYWLF